MKPIITSLMMYICAGLVGIVAHYVSKWARGEIKGNLFYYLFIDNPKWTLATLMGFFASAAGLLAAGSISMSTDPLMLLGAGFGIGWACDSAITKGVTP